MRIQRFSRPAYVGTVEVLFYVPIIILLLVAIVQFAKVLSVEARLAGASREGARVAASGGNAKQINDAVYLGLFPEEKEFAQIESNAVDSQGKPLASLQGGAIVVRVSIPTQKAVSVPLRFILDKNRILVGQTVMRKE